MCLKYFMVLSAVIERVRVMVLGFLICEFDIMMPVVVI